MIHPIQACPAPYASRHACSRTDATLFWTCIKIAKALRDFHGGDWQIKAPWKGCKPNFVCAGCPAERIIYLLRPYPEPESFPIPGRTVPWPPIWSCTQWGLPCRLACAWRGGLLPHLFTLTAAEAVAVCFLWHFPSVILTDKLPACILG